MNIRQSFRRLSRRSKLALSAATALVLYSAFGFLLLPYLMKSGIVSTIRDSAKREATVRAVTFNPFTLELVIEGLEIADLDGSEFAGFERFDVDFELSSIFKRAFVFKLVSLAGIHGRVVVKPDGRENFADLLEGGAEADEAEEDETAAGGMPPVLIQELRIEDGRFSFDDRSRPTPFKVELAPIRIELSDFSTLAEHEGPYSFTATTARGESFEWQGEVSVNPPRSSGSFTLSGIRLRTLWEYVQDEVRFAIDDGVVEIGADYAVDIGAEPASIKLSGGSLAMTDFALSQKGSKPALISIPRLSVDGVSVDVGAARASIASIKSSDGSLSVWLDPSGTLNYQTLFASSEEIAGDASEDTGDRASDAAANTADAAVEADTARAAAQPPAADATTETVSGNAAPEAGGDQHAAIPPARDAAQADEAKPWTLSIDSFALDRYSVSFEDRSPADKVQLDLAPISLSLNNIDSAPAARFDLALSTGLNKTATLKAEGKVGADPPFAELELDFAGIPLAAFQPYMDTATYLKLNGGTASIAGNLLYGAGSGERPELTYRGAAAIEQLDVRDRRTSTKLAAWKSLALQGMNLRPLAKTFEMDGIALDGLSLEVVAEPDGTINLATVVKSEKAPPPASAAAERDAAAGAAAPAGQKTEASAAAPEDEQDAQPTSFKVGELKISGAAIDFTDKSVKPPVETGIDKLDATVKGLSSEASARLDLQAQGRLNGRAPLSISGSLDPADPESYTALRIALGGAGLTRLTPYSGRFAGYTIAQGKLTLDLNYEIADKKLQGDNKVLLDKFTFGDRTDSPDATSLPVRLAIALLKDRNGQIKVDMPVEGDLADPEFSYGGLVVQTIVNLITKVVSSPFAALGNLVGIGAEELDFVAFTPGSAKLEASQSDKLDTLAKALSERPALRLEITGHAERGKDSAALAAARLQARLRAAKLAELAAAGQTPAENGEAVVLDDADYLRLLEAAYVGTFGQTPEAAAAQADTERTDAEKAEQSDVDPAELARREALRRREAMEQRLISEITVDDKALGELAAERAEQVKNQLIEVGGIEDARLFFVEPTIGEKSDSDEVKVPLSLSGS